MSAPFDRRLRRFAATRESLLRRLEASDPALLRERPAEGKWSALEIAEHLSLAERAILRGLPPRAELVPLQKRRRPLRLLLVKAVLLFRVAVPVPAAVMVPSGSMELPEVAEKWREAERWFADFCGSLDGEGARRVWFAHPVAGALTASQALLLNMLHFRTHARQIDRILGSR